MGRESADGGWWERKQIHGSGDCSSRARAPPERDAWMGGGRGERGRGSSARPRRKGGDAATIDSADGEAKRDGGSMMNLSREVPQPEIVLPYLPVPLHHMLGAMAGPLRGSFR